MAPSLLDNLHLLSVREICALSRLSTNLNCRNEYLQIPQRDPEFSSICQISIFSCQLDETFKYKDQFFSTNALKHATRSFFLKPISSCSFRYHKFQSYKNGKTLSNHVKLYSRSVIWNWPLHWKSNLTSSRDFIWQKVVFDKRASFPLK